MIRAIYPDVISILMTGYPGISSAIKGLRQNIHDYLIKPFSVEQAIASIERSVTNDSLRRSNSDLTKQIKELKAEIQDLRQQMEKMTAVDQKPAEPKKHVDQARAHKIYLEQQGRLK
jgi:DNA-binding NtrC family response regulator